MRSGKWKYINDGEGEYLYDLSVDEREVSNFAGTEAQKVVEMRDRLKAWESQMVPYPKAKV